MRQPSTSVFICGFQACQCLIDLAEARQNGGYEYLRYLLPAAQLFQFLMPIDWSTDSGDAGRRIPASEVSKVGCSYVGFQAALPSMMPPHI